MTQQSQPATLNRAVAFLNYIFLLLAILVIAGILTAAMSIQYAEGELPCPLCLLERLALFGVCFGIIQNLRHGFSYQNTGLSLLFTIFLLIVSVRQSLLDIYPRPGHEYIGSAIFGIHMPVWSILIALALLIAYALKLSILGANEHMRDHKIESFPVLKPIATVLGLYVIALCAVNAISVVLQCGLGQCHTFSYRLLQ